MQIFPHTNKNGGYIALMATIIISLVLLVMIVNEGFAGWMTRFVVLGTEAKEQANALAEGCADQALASLITDPNYLGNTTSNTPGGNCKVFAIDPADLQAGLVTVKTQAAVRDAFANLELLQSVNNLHLGAIPSAPNYGTLIVQTLVNNPSSGTQLTPGDFTMNIASVNPSKSSFAGSATGVIVTIPTNGGMVAYSVSETLVPGFAGSYTAPCSGSIKGGDIKSCTVTNNPVTTTLTLIANVKNDDGTGTATPASVPLFIDGTPATLGQAYTVSAGSHTVTATSPNSSIYSVSSWGYQCTGAMGAGSASLNLGDNKVCVINFDDNPPPAPVCAETVMMLDRSYSMFSNSTWIPDEKTAAKALVDLYAGVTSSHPLLSFGRFGDVTTGVSAEIVSTLQNNYAAIKTAIDGGLPQNPISYTNLAAAITKGNEELNSVRHQAGKEKVLILISDGDPNQPSSGSTISTGFFYPTASVQNANGDLWQNATGTYAQGGGEATDAAAAGHRHRFYNFNLPTIPSNATIQGIELVADAWATTTATVPGPTQNVQKAPSAAATPNQWSTPTAASVSDNMYATSTTLNQQQGFGTFGFAIPPNATITGIQVSFEGKVGGSGGSNTTSTLYPAGQGSDSSWNGNEGDVDETFFVSCSSNDRIDSNNNGNRESVNIDLSSIPNNSVITSVQVLTWDQGSTNGQYQSFVYTNNVRTNSPTITITGSSNCAQRTQTIDIPDFVKTGGSALEVGVQKVGNTTVQVGAIRALVTYTNPVSGSATVALSSNNGSSYTATKTVPLTATEAAIAPTGNSATDLWGRTWLPADFNNGNFIVRVQNTSNTGIITSLDQLLVTVNYRLPTAASADCQLNADLSWNGGSSWTTEKSQTISEMLASYTFGSVSDDWSGHTWAPSEFTNANFRARIRSVDPGSGCDNASVEHVDSLRLQVSYFAPVTPQEAALAAADAAKLADTNIFTIYFGSGNPTLLAQLASGVTANGSHQPGSYNDPNGVASGNTGAISPTANAADTGGSGTGFEGNAAGAYTDGSTNATNFNGLGDRHRYSGYNFSIPPGATINGIVVRADWWTNSTQGTNSMNVELSWDGGSTWSAAKTQSTESTNDTNNKTLGASNDLWGRAWSASDFSTGNFRVRTTVNCSGGSFSCSSRIFSLDWLPVTVYYTVNNENGDGDNFFIAPTSADMKGIFEFIGNQVCPAINNVSATTPPTTANLLVITQVINNNSGSSQPSDFTVGITGSNVLSGSFTGLATPGKLVTLDPGAYSVAQTASPSGYTTSYTDSCTSDASGTIAAGESRVCIIVNDDIPPPPPPPNLSLTPGSWQEVPATTP